MGYLDKVVELCAGFDTCATHCGTVNRSIGTYFHVILYDDIAKLRDFIIMPVNRGKTEPVCTNHCPGMEYAPVPYLATVIYLYTRIYHGVLPYCRIFPDICMWIDFCAPSNFRILTDIGKRADIGIIGYVCTVCDKRWLLNPYRIRLEHLCRHFHKLCHCGIRVVHPYQRTLYRFLRLECLTDQNS